MSALEEYRKHPRWARLPHGELTVDKQQADATIAELEAENGRLKDERTRLATGLEIADRYAGRLLRGVAERGGMLRLAADDYAHEEWDRGFPLGRTKEDCVSEWLADLRARAKEGEVMKAR